MRAKGVPDALRKAVERTFAATAEGAAETREPRRRSARPGRPAAAARRATASPAAPRRPARARPAPLRRVIEAIEGMRLASREDVKALSDQVDELSKRVSELEKKPKVEG